MNPHQMTDLKLEIDDRPSRATMVLAWLPRIAAALCFLSIGWDKFSPDGMWVRLFETIGIGQWFRYATGALQIAGAILLLVPRVGWIGGALLAGTMAGATLVQIVVFHSPTAIIPAILAGILTVIALAVRAQESR